MQLDPRPESVSPRGAPKSARTAFNLSDVQDAIGIAIGGRVAGLVFEGDRRFPIVIRLSDASCSDIETIESLPILLPQTAANGVAPTIPLRHLATFEFAEGPNQISRQNGKRYVAVTVEVRGRDIGSLVEEARRRLPSTLRCRPVIG